MSIPTKKVQKKSKSNHSVFRKQKNSKSSSNKQNSSAQDILTLHQTLGNQAVQRLFESDFIQGKLIIGKPNDKYEQEADRVADEVMRMPEPQVQRQSEEDEEEEMIQTKPIGDQITPLIQRQVEPEEEEEAEPEKEEEETIQTKSEEQTPQVTSSLESKINALQGGGQPLSRDTRNFFEPRFGHDFSNVKIHANSNANQLARSINAKAFTKGKDIVFGGGEYSPGSSKGKRLLGHELTHVVQQKEGSIQSATQMKGKANHNLIQRKCNPVAAKRFYSKTQMGKKVQWTIKLVEELYKIVGNANKVLYENVKLSGVIDSNFIVLVCIAQKRLGFKGRNVDGKIGPKTMGKWKRWKTGGKHGIDYSRLFKDKKLEIGIAMGYDKKGLTKLSSNLIFAVLKNKKYGLKLTLATASFDRYAGKRKYKVQGDNTAPDVIIEIIIDITDANKAKPKNTFSNFLTKKEMTIYVGHARYGTGPDFDPKKSAAENFIIGVNSALHKANKLKKGYNSEMNTYLKGKANELEKLSKAGKFNLKTYQVWFLNACKTIDYMDEIRGGLVADAKGNKKSQDDLRIMGTKQTVGVGSAGVILRGILEMQTMEEIMKFANKKQRGRKQRYFAN